MERHNADTLLRVVAKRKTIIILGGGTGGLVVANELRRKVGERARIILIDKNKSHIFAPAFLYLMLGKRKVGKIQKPLSLLERKGIEFVNDEIVGIEPENKTIKTKNQRFQYDYLVISLGAELSPEKIIGLAESGHNLYSLQGVKKLRSELKNFASSLATTHGAGKVAIVISSLPFKCPAAPYEAAFLLNEYFQKQGVRDKTEISIFTPETLPMPAAGPDNGKAIQAMVETQNIKFHPEVQLLSVDPHKKELKFEDEKRMGFDFLIFVPPHQAPRIVQDAGIGNETGWIAVDSKTLKTDNYENVFAIGDIAAITLASGKPLPKAGVFAHFEAEVVAENIANELKGLSANREYDGRGYCFLETGFGKAGFASGNFYAVPTPKVKLKQPSRIWHWGKWLFEKYWFWKWF